MTTPVGTAPFLGDYRGIYRGGQGRFKQGRAAKQLQSLPGLGGQGFLSHLKADGPLQDVEGFFFPVMDVRHEVLYDPASRER